MSECKLDRIRRGWPERARQLADEQVLSDDTIRSFPCLIVLEAAIELGVGDLLDQRRPSRLSTLATQLNAQPARLEAVLSLLAAMQLVSEGPDGYRLLARGALVLPSSAPREILSPCLDVYRLARPWLQDYVAILRGAKSSVALAWPPRDLEESVAFERLMTATSPYVAAFIDEKADVRKLRSLLDVGGGDGTVVSLLCQKHRNLRASVVNLPHVEPLVMATAESYGVEDRVSFVACDFLNELLPDNGFDAIVFARMLCDWDDRVVRNLLEQCPGAVRRDGIVWICETLDTPGRVWDADPWFTLWKTLVQGYWQYGPRTARAWERLAQGAGLSVSERVVNSRQPLPGLVLQTLLVGETIADAPGKAADRDEANSTRPWLLQGDIPSSIQTPRSDHASARVRLHANELNEPWPSEVLNAVADAVRQEPLYYNPDPDNCSLRRSIGDSYGVSVEQVVLGVGSLEIVLLLSRALAAAGGDSMNRVLIPEPTFPAYSEIAGVVGLEVVSVSLQEDFQIDETGMRRELERGVGLCFLARPNNPTGTLWSAQTLRSLITAFPLTVFAIDEVYLPFADSASLWDGLQTSNVVCFSSLSKVGLVGVRLGYAIASEELAERLRAQQLPFSIPRVAAVVAETMLVHCGGAQRDVVERVVANRARLTNILRQVPEATVFPSVANMVLVRLSSPKRARAFADRLERNGIFVHRFPRDDRLADCVRVTVGTSDDLDLLEGTIASWLRVASSESEGSLG